MQWEDNIMAISVLIVEDDKNIAELLQMYLERKATPLPSLRTVGRALPSSVPSSRTWCFWM